MYSYVLSLQNDSPYKDGHGLQYHHWYRLSQRFISREVLQKRFLKLIFVNNTLSSIKH